ncbi:hypothetical protein [Gloeocapsopsis sp. IPPAS B-1203]|uniref:hypothetical protein n=1 Tax=Gloeocapsopsis sp. IPPAS B-1203 TaxID=2049454 RepID=UPI000C188EA6|nr:hypothetical protein [Gloeocapsopsis sp. IPPAS B-1203]PIG94588.1 hypothetical protein CSQ79_04740 [Gloeocapsopsis sp. IPPAS B-1203]
MQQVIDPLKRKALADCFYLEVPLINASDDEITHNIANAIAIEQVATAMLDGSMSIEDLLESAEDLIADMDTYVEEVEANLEETLLILP